MAEAAHSFDALSVSLVLTLAMEPIIRRFASDASNWRGVAREAAFMFGVGTLRYWFAGGERGRPILTFAAGGSPSLTVDACCLCPLLILRGKVTRIS